MTFYKDCPAQQYPNGMNYEIQTIIILKALKATEAKKLF